MITLSRIKQLTVFGNFWIDWQLEQKISLVLLNVALQLQHDLATWHKFRVIWKFLQRTLPTMKIFLNMFLFHKSLLTFEQSEEQVKNINLNNDDNFLRSYL